MPAKPAEGSRTARAGPVSSDDPVLGHRRAQLVTVTIDRPRVSPPGRIPARSGCRHSCATIIADSPPGTPTGMEWNSVLSTMVSNLPSPAGKQLASATSKLACEAALRTSSPKPGFYGGGGEVSPTVVCPRSASASSLHGHVEDSRGAALHDQGGQLGLGFADNMAVGLPPRRRRFTRQADS